MSSTLAVFVEIEAGF